MTIYRSLLVLAGIVALPSAGISQGEMSSSWTRLQLKSGARVEYPTKIFTVNKTHVSSIFPVFDREDAKAHFTFFLKDNPGRHSLDELAATNTFAIDYKRVTKKFFVVSGVWNGLAVYRRCNVGQGSTQLACFDISYPVAELHDWDAIVTRISYSLRAS